MVWERFWKDVLMFHPYYKEMLFRQLFLTLWYHKIKKRCLPLFHYIDKCIVVYVINISTCVLSMSVPAWIFFWSVQSFSRQWLVLILPFVAKKTLEFDFTPMSFCFFLPKSHLGCQILVLNRFSILLIQTTTMANRTLGTIKIGME